MFRFDHGGRVLCAQDELDAALPRAVTHGGGDGGGGVRLCHVRALYMLVEERLEGGPLTRVAAACVCRAIRCC